MAALLAAPARAAHVPPRAADVTFVRVWIRWSKAAPFHRISEYLTGRENFGGRIVLRSHPSRRAGLYFLVRVKHPGPLIPGVRFDLQVIAPGNPLPRTFSFPFNLPAGGKVCDLGLTGDDWPNRNEFPIAWKLALLAADGRILAETRSFLWSKP